MIVDEEVLKAIRRLKVDEDFKVFWKWLSDNVAHMAVEACHLKGEDRTLGAGRTQGIMEVGNVINTAEYTLERLMKGKV